jgi:hypothetical protein
MSPSNLPVERHAFRALSGTSRRPKPWHRRGKDTQDPRLEDAGAFEVRRAMRDAWRAQNERG